MSDVGYEINQIPILLPSERTITGAKLKSPFIYDQYREICTNGAQDRRVLVVGSGPNTEAWRTLGCTTLDIDPTVRPDFTADANLNLKVKSGSQDIIVSEYLTLDPTGKEGVNLDRYLPLVFASLAKVENFFSLALPQL